MTSSADIIATLLAHAMILDRGNHNKPTSGTSNTVLSARTTGNTNEPCGNPNCKAKKRSTHTTANCYWPGGGKEGQFPPNFGQRAKANLTTSTGGNEVVEHFVLSACITDTPGNTGVIIDNVGNTRDIYDYTPEALVSKGFQSFGMEKIPTFLDSGASDTMFFSQESFTDYRVIPTCVGDSAKVVDGSFEIVGEGKVIQHSFVDGKVKDITYTHALHTPSLNANLISISAFDKAGLTATFGGSHGVIWKSDGTAVLVAKLERGMYLVDELRNGGDNPTALRSNSQATSLEQWHRRLTHCSPSTILEMVSGNLVDGLRISARDLRGKCEDCVLGCQTRRPFDGATEMDLELLELVSFDLWGTLSKGRAEGQSCMCKCQ
jgi:hypothetical protein